MTAVFTIGHGTRPAEELVAWMGTEVWQLALAEALAEPSLCFMCAETLWTRWHRRLIAELLVARGHSVMHLMRPGPASRTGSTMSRRCGADVSTSVGHQSHRKFRPVRFV